MIELLGYLCAAFVGFSLGIFGSGGSILTVPIMVYLLNINPVDATGYSLFVVGFTSAIGGITYIRKKLVNFKTAIYFGLPSVLTVFLTRKYIMPDIPEIIFASPSIIITREIFIMLIFSVLMVLVAYNMIYKSQLIEIEAETLQEYDIVRLTFIGFLSGILTGLLGVGGGFIIMPALVWYGNVSVRKSVGTSLLIIAFNSLSGFTEEIIDKHAVMDYFFLFCFTFLSCLGIYIGFRLSLKLNSAQLKKMFGWFMLAMGIVVFLYETLLHIH